MSNLQIISFLLFFSFSMANWDHECPDKRKSLGHCLAGLCPFEAECINDQCCEFPKLPKVVPQTVIESTSTTPIPDSQPMKPDFESGSSEEMLKRLIKRVKTKSPSLIKKLTTIPLSTSTTTTTTTPKILKLKTKKMKPSTTTTTTTTEASIIFPEESTCSDGRNSIGECMDGLCPDGYLCEKNGYCCQCPNYPIPCTSNTTTISLITTTVTSTTTTPTIDTTNIIINTKNRTTISEDIWNSIETNSGEQEDLLENEKTTKKPTKKIRIKTTTLKPISTTVADLETPETTTTEVPTTTEDYQVKNVCLVAYPIGECVDHKCPDQHECIQNYCCPITPAINCSDILRSCKSYLCQKQQYLEFMTKNCGRTCRRCDQQIKNGDERPKRPKRCRDSRNDCDEWAAEGFCQSALYSMEQKRHLCGKSCKLC